MTTAARHGPKDKFYRRSAAASVLGIELTGQSWRDLQAQLRRAPVDIQEAYKNTLRKYRTEGVPTKHIGGEQ